MSKKIKFNIHGIFMEGQNTVADRNLFVASPLFPVFVSIYNRASGKVKVGLLKTKQAPDGKTFISEIPIVTPLGLRVASLENRSSEYNVLSFGVSVDVLSNHTASALRTSNPKYIQSQMSPSSEKDCATAFDNRLNDSADIFNQIIRSMIDTSIDGKFGRGLSSAPSFISRSHIVLFKKYTEERDKFKSALANTLDMVSTEKWVYITNVNGGVILGAIRPEPMCAALDKYTSENVLPFIPSHSYVQESVPFKWYPSFDHIPEEYREGLTFSMVMLKAHTGSADMLPTAGVHHYYELGAFCACDSPIPVYVLTK